MTKDYSISEKSIRMLSQKVKTLEIETQLEVISQ
jgi:hypothetical protein